MLAEVPIILNDSNSVFSTQAFLKAPRTTYAGGQRWAKLIAGCLPSNSRNLCRERCLSLLAEALAGTIAPKVLVIGSGDGDTSYGALAELPGIRILETDVSTEGGPSLVCDCHDLPFDAALFDAVICEAVLEHVFNPQRCVEEIHRVLKPAGLVFAATPFMQQVHLGPFDFTRFTRTGHRALFSRFHEVESGMGTGPASVLLWSIEYFFLAWTSSLTARRILKATARLLLGWLPYLDHVLARRVSALDGAGGFYFIGRAAEAVVFTAQDAIAYYRGSDGAK